jgi:LPS-assembly protein
MTPRRITLCLTLLLALASSLTAQAPPAERPPKFNFIPGPKPGGGEVKWSVDRNGNIDFQREDYAILENNVVIEYQDIKLRADKVTWNQRTSDVTAEGHVVIDQGPTRMSATQAIYNLNTKTGTFFNATGTMDPSMYFSGDRIEKVDDDTYRLTNGIFTSCELDDPAWSFHIGDADVTLDDYARMRDVSIRAKKLPIFYTPRLIWPTKRDRSAGFLIPRYLYSEDYGQRLEVAYYAPIRESADVTFFTDLNTEGFFGVGANVRYLPSHNVKLGELDAHAVRNADDNTIEWKYDFQHAQENLPGGFRGVVDVEDFSELDFFRQYDRDPELHLRSQIYSSAYLTRNRPTYSLNILTDRRDQIFPGDARSRFEQLPSLQVRMYPQRIGNTPVYFSLESSSSHLRTSGVSAAGEISRGADYFRTDIFPTLSMQLRTPPWFSVKPQLSLRETFYSATLDPVTQTNTGDSLNRFYAQGQVEVVGPTFSRVFNRGIANFARFKHVIEPRFRYVYTSNVDDQDRVIRFDTVDSPFLPIVRDTVEYSLTQRILAKERGENTTAREIASFSLRQTVALSDPFTPNNSGGLPFGAEHRFSNLDANVRVNPYQSFTIDANAQFGNVSHQLDNLSLSANLIGTGEHADKYVSLSYVESFRQPGSPFEGLSAVRVNTGSSFANDRIRADVQLNFDAKQGKFLEQRYLAGWTGSCYGIALEYRQYEVVVPGQLNDNASYGIAITLKNVGTVGTH